MIGSVTVVAFARKLHMIRSSNAIVNAMNPPEIMPGMIIGTVICRKV